MKKPDNHRLPAFRFYSLLVSLYPADYRQAFGAQMLQTFTDQYTDMVEHQGRIGLAFWFAVVGDEVTGIA